MNLRKFIQRHRAEYDNIEEVPTEAMWMGIQQRRHRKTRRRRIIYAAAAAVVLVLVLIPSLWHSTPQDSRIPAGISEELIQTEKNYYQLAASKKAEMNFDQLDQATYGELLNELKILDSMYADYRADLVNAPEASAMIATAIRFHERRLRILELIEKEIQNQKRTEEYEEQLQL